MECYIVTSSNNKAQENENRIIKIINLQMNMLVKEFNQYLANLSVDY